MSKNNITGDSLRSRPLSPEGEANWDRIFGGKKEGVCPYCNDDGRACAYPSENKPGCLHYPKETTA